MPSRDVPQQASAFHGIGKRKWLNIVKGNKECCKKLGLLGENLQIKDPLFDITKSMICQLIDFENLTSMTSFDMRNVAGRNFLTF